MFFTNSCVKTMEKHSRPPPKIQTKWLWWIRWWDIQDILEGMAVIQSSRGEDGIVGRLYTHGSISDSMHFGILLKTIQNCKWSEVNRLMKYLQGIIDLMIGFMVWAWEKRHFKEES